MIRVNEDNASYIRFTGPQRLDKAMHTLEGMVRGLTIDSQVTDRELSLLTGWLGEHAEFADRHPFNEVIPVLHGILADGVIDEEEKADILFLCSQFATDNTYFSQVTSDMQRLQGIVAGIAADGVITKDELEGLSEWMELYSHLRTCWPYDELEALIVAVLKDGRIDEAEQRQLLEFFGEFSDHVGHRAIGLTERPERKLITGICAVCPDIVIPDRLFCFTGKSKRCSRNELAGLVTRKGGRFSKTLVKEADFLVIGADGNPCWAFACYGRKVETAIDYRKQGCRLLIVHENDFWDVVGDID